MSALNTETLPDGSSHRNADESGAKSVNGTVFVDTAGDGGDAGGAGTTVDVDAQTAPPPPPQQGPSLFLQKGQSGQTGDVIAAAFAAAADLRQWTKQELEQCSCPREEGAKVPPQLCIAAVSYTHLTLPTIYSV